MINPIHASSFRAYDIRGVIGETLFPETAFLLGRAFATTLQTQGYSRVVIGRDGRRSSPDLAQALSAGLQASGATVTDIGVGPTPMLYYATKLLNSDAGIMVTGSHNPPNHNGFKMLTRDTPIYGDAIQDLYRVMQGGAFYSGQGSATTASVQADYVARLRRDSTIASNLTVVWDPGHGAAASVIKDITASLPGTHYVLNDTIDGSFPSHHPDPSEAKNLQQLIAAVRAKKADIGLAFDGDGDRVGMVDDSGTIWWGDQFLRLLAADVLQRHPKASIIADVKASDSLFAYIESLGGKAVMGRTGHSLIKVLMKETGALLAGEMSGHVFFADGYYGFDDGIYAAVRLLNCLTAANRPLSQRQAQLPRLFSTPEIRLPCADDKKFAVVAAIAAIKHPDVLSINTLDGVRVRTPDGWWLLRASNTQPMLVLRAEASSDMALQAMLRYLASVLQAYDIQGVAA